MPKGFISRDAQALYPMNALITITDAALMERPKLKGLSLRDAQALYLMNALIAITDAALMKRPKL